jgi:hypothetical protein
VFWVPEEILESFDAWCWERRVSRTDGLVGLMADRLGVPVPVSGPPVKREPVVSVAGPLSGPVLKERLQAKIDGVCAHPRAQRKVFSWGAKCMGCGKVNP